MPTGSCAGGPIRRGCHVRPAAQDGTAAAAHTVHAAYLWPRRPRAVIPEGPHRRDVPLRDIIDILLTARPAGLSVEGANPRHAHEWNVFQTVRLPPGKVLIPGVLDTTTNYVEHPALVAERLVRFARIVGTERVIGGADCGFGTLVGMVGVHADVAWAKLGSLVAGARLASARLGGSTSEDL